MRNKDEMESFLMKLFFTYAWKKRPKYCECGCDISLPSEIDTSCMDHTIEKSTNPECKYSLKNIRYYTSNCHNRKTNGFPNEVQKDHIRLAWENYESLKDESSKFVERVNNKLNGIFDKE